MRKGIVIVLAAFTTTGCSQLFYRGLHAPARRPIVAPAPLASSSPIGRWDLVMRLPRGSVVDVLSMNGEALVGPVSGVDGFAVRVIAQGVEQQIPRADVLRVDLIDLPGSEVREAARGAGLGAALGVGAAAIMSGVIGGSAWPPPGSLLRGGAAIGALAGGEAALAARQGGLIYLAEHQASNSNSYGSGRPSRVVQRDAPARFARSYSAKEWPAIVDLSPGQIVRVVRTNGRSHQGALLVADDTALRLDVEGAELRITRASIERVEVLEMPAAAARKMESPLGASPLVRLGAPTLLFGGAQAQILRFPAVPSLDERSSIGVPVVGVSTASRVTRMSVCHATAVRMR